MGKNKSLIILTGGGTAGHVTPHFALIPELEAAGLSYHYIGSEGIEKELAENAGIAFSQIYTGKLRRYFSLQNFWDVFKVFAGLLQSIFYLMRLQPKMVFSKGGFVAVPVCAAARLLNIPVITHESDLTPGLATKIIGRFARKILHSFPETSRYLSKEKAVWVGAPIRPEIMHGVKHKGDEYLAFDSRKNRNILVMGGSLGAQSLNDLLVDAFPQLADSFNIIHLTGRGKSTKISHPNDLQREFIGDELADIYASVDLAICRAGSNSIFELLALKIPMLLIPLEHGSRGDQVYNAESFVARGWAMMGREAAMNTQEFISLIFQLDEKRSQIIANQSDYDAQEVAKNIMASMELYL